MNSIHRCAFFLGLMLTLPYAGAIAPASSPAFEQQIEQLASKPNQVSDREKAGLRGRVKRCVERSITPADASGVGTEKGFTTTTEYDPEGRILSERTQNSKGWDYVRTWAYDAQGRVVKSTSGQTGAMMELTYAYDAHGHLLKTVGKRPGAPPEETTYLYDTSGRLLRVTSNTYGGEHSEFRYDDEGRKIRVQTFLPRAAGSQAGFVGSSLAAAELGFTVPNEGGTVTTTYNEQDKATEAQVRDAEGQLLSRVILTYDMNGQLVDERNVIENPQSMVPAKLSSQLNEAQTKSIGTWIALRLGYRRASYRYDAEGHVIETRQRLGSVEEMVTSVAYNKQGDKAEEHTEQHEDPDRGREFGLDEIGNMIPVREKAEASGQPIRSEVRYTYQYDSFDNWTEQKVESRSDPNTTFQTSMTYHRELAYY